MVDEAAKARARQRLLEQQANDDANLIALLLDLSERKRAVLITTTGSHRVRGMVVAIGIDFVVVREPRLGDVIVPLRCLALVRTLTSDDVAGTERPVAFEVSLAVALAELAEEQPTVVVSAGGDEFRGRLRSAGSDLIVVKLDGARRELIHAATHCLDHLVVLRD